MSAKNLDKQNRWRNKTVAFRMSSEEAEQLDVNVRLSGLSKQDYLIQRALQREIKVIGNPRVYKALKNTMAEVLEELRRIGVRECVSDDLLDTIRQIDTTLNGLKEEGGGG
jgi:hypothetical protein